MKEECAKCEGVMLLEDYYFEGETITRPQKESMVVEMVCSKCDHIEGYRKYENGKVDRVY